MEPNCLNPSRKLRYHITCFIYICFNAFICGQPSVTDGKIEGKIDLDTIWNNKLYLSHISDFSKMYTMSRSMIIAESEIDSLGHFQFNIEFLPKENKLYRIHISKKGSSQASIIIGGKDENHIFIIANSKSNIEFKNHNKIFNDVTFIKDHQNQIVDKIDDIVKLIDSTNFNSNRLKSEFVANAFNQQLRKIADTSSFPLVSLYALNKSKYETDLKNNTEFYQDFLDKWKNEDTVYFQNFKNKIPDRKTTFSKNILIGLIVLVAFVLGFFTSTFFKNTKLRKKNPIKSLSIQERKVFRLLKAGNSNKEISDELNIGVSTVKSHVSSIYSKLNIKSRKEVINFYS